uniref:DNA repair protein SWI5 homolog n=1 Tax=Rhinopithecus bieti TaxID=61621 RepID=A0A2K6N5G4_RHIBE
MGEGSAGPGPRSLETRAQIAQGGLVWGGRRTEPGLTRSCRGAFRSPGYSVDELEDHITQLHEYNDIKDVGQMLMGKL